MIFEKWELEYIKNNYKTKTYSEITLYINQFNHVKKTEHQVRTRASYMKLSKIDTDVDRHYFDTIDNENKAYWLGFIYADGWVSSNGRSYEVGIELGAKDIIHLEKFKKCINSRSNIISTHKHLIICNNTNFTDTDTCKIRVYSVVFLKHIQKRIKNFGFDSAIYYEGERKSRIYINGDQADKKRFLDFLYLNSIIYLDRKFNSYNGLAI